MLNKYEQTIQVVSQLTLKKYEGLHVRWRRLDRRILLCRHFRRDDFLGATTAQQLDPFLEFCNNRLAFGSIV